MPIVWEAIGASILPNIGGWAATPFTIKATKSWYKTLNRPPWAPPDWAFGPVWTVLYTAMGFASYLVWRDGGGFTGRGRTALALYIAQLILNWAWAPIFFGLHSIGGGLIDIVLLYGTAGVASIAMFRINRTAGYLMVPYMLWLSLATALNYYIWRNNPSTEEQDFPLEP
ncbi:translocator protein-like [Neocloeon triangulifer]|uniref:translocator protein-like n=1 Tax=Neocloeon triangulifer TaxID=2078957 RepID=UPI00286F5687|nr:translocator protein-like [Neocloeon triangulifer]